MYDNVHGVHEQANDVEHTYVNDNLKQEESAYEMNRLSSKQTKPPVYDKLFMGNK